MASTSSTPGGRFVIIGENIHATRAFSLTGRHIARDPSGDERIVFHDSEGAERRLPIPAWYRDEQAYAEGRVKHVAIAIRVAMAGEADADTALAYLAVLARRQVDAGAGFIDLNVDELSPRLEVQRRAMDWLVRAIQAVVVVPVSIDSSHVDILASGLAAAEPGSRPMLNSASLERIDALDLPAGGGPVVVTAAGRSGMPADAAQRLDNASRMVEAAQARGFEIEGIFIDPLIFPVSVDGEFGRHSLDAIAALRGRFGPRVHITGGMSNVSFGVPGRRLLNDVFLALAIEAGADSGIIDPTVTHPDRLATLDPGSRAYSLARDALLGIDAGFRAYLRAYRTGELAELGIAPAARPTR